MSISSISFSLCIRQSFYLFISCILRTCQWHHWSELLCYIPNHDKRATNHLQDFPCWLILRRPTHFPSFLFYLLEQGQSSALCKAVFNVHYTSSSNIVFGYRRLWVKSILNASKPLPLWDSVARKETNQLLYKYWVLLSPWENRILAPEADSQEVDHELKTSSRYRVRHFI